MDNNYMVTVLAACLTQLDDNSKPACQQHLRCAYPDHLHNSVISNEALKISEPTVFSTTKIYFDKVWTNTVQLLVFAVYKLLFV